MTLQDFFKENPSVALGFSGGTDSSFLLWAAMEYGARVGAYFVKTAFQPEFELEDARRLAAGLGANLTVMELDVLANPVVCSNPANRCYYCKQVIFGAIAARARADGWALLIDGTNASDDASDRPGMRALSELKVRSPLRECGITKSEVREKSRQAGLFTWDKPSYACLATRVLTGDTISAEKLKIVEENEEKLRKMGFFDLRLRLVGAGARLELPENQHERAFEKWDEICAALSVFDKIELSRR